MALSLPDLRLIARLGSQGYICRRRIAEIGAQQLDPSIVLTGNGDLEAVGRAFGVCESPPLLVAGPAEPDNALAGAPSARLLWQWLGFEYTAIDIDGTPEAVALDLNFDEVPAPMRGRYGLVTNFGSTEHIINQSNTFTAMHDLTGTGGIMLHHVPTHQPEHGFFAYNVKFFRQLARANDYREVYCSSLGTPAVGLQIVLQKQHDLPFLTPLDVGPTPCPANSVLRDRYWSLFDPDQLTRVALSTEAELERRKEAILAREQLQAYREDEFRVRERAIYLREQAAAAWERAHLSPILRLRMAVARHIPWIGKTKRRLMRNFARNF